jgi:hypothetical protein
MKRLALLLSLLAAPALAQTFGSGNTLPGSCTNGDRFYKQAIPVGYYNCVSGAWTMAGRIGATLAPNNGILVGDGTNWIPKTMGDCKGLLNALTFDASTNAVGCNTFSAGGATAWGTITGTLSAQTDLQTALNGKQASGSYQAAGSYSGVGPCAANQWASTLNASGAPTCTQPAFSNLSGAVTDAQVPDNITVSLAATAAALAANGGNCSGNNFAVGVDASGVGECAQPAFSNLSGTATIAQLPFQVLRVTGSDVSNSTTTPATITGLSFTAAASTAYGIDCTITATGTATSLPRFNLSGPASPTAVALRTDRAVTTSTQTLLVVNAFSAAAQTAACTTACAATALVSHFFGTIMNGANAGTVALQLSSSTAGQTVTVGRGSVCTVY